MRDRHAPDLEFVERLESHISADVRRRNRYADMPRWTRWLAQSPIKAASAAALLILMSMGVGGIVVAAAYQAQTNEQLTALHQQYMSRQMLARERFQLAADALKVAERQASVGIEPQDTLLEARFKLAEAEAQLQGVVLEATELDASGREPINAVSAPVVSGRDFVSERWKIDMQIPRAALDMEKARLQTLQRRVDVGAASRIDLEVSRARVVELQASIQSLQTKIGVRERFLKKEIDAPLADLYVLEAEAVQRRQTIAPRLELQQRVVKDLQARVEIGVAALLDVSQAQVKLKELELDMSKAEVDLGVIRRQIDQRRLGK